jgi:hypothetical protein
MTKNELMTSTAAAHQSNFDWEPDLALVPSAGGDGGSRQGSLKGDVRLKYVFPEHWTADGVPATGRILLLHDIHYAIIRWPTDAEKARGVKGPETIPVERGAPEPDLKALNAGVPEENWPINFGKKEPPYKLQRILEFLDRANMDQLSWPHYVEVTGATICKEEVCKRIATVRKIVGEDLYAMVKLNHRPFTNNYNKNLERPWLEIAGWARLGSHGIEVVDITKPQAPPQGAAEKLDQVAMKTINAEPAKTINPAPIKPSPANVPLGAEMDDGIPWK